MLLSKDGDFLVRESGTTPGQYVLTGQQGGQPKHLLLVDPEGVVRMEGGACDSWRRNELRGGEVIIILQSFCVFIRSHVTIGYMIYCKI